MSETDNIIRQSAAKVWKRDPRDWYCEEDGIWRAFFAVEKFRGLIYDPACGRGNVCIEAEESGLIAFGSDIATFEERPSLWERASGGIDFSLLQSCVENICSNPPFKHVDPRSRAEKQNCFLRLALKRTTHKVALLMPSSWLNARSWLRETPHYRTYHLTPRPAMPPGEVFMDKTAGGKRLGNGKQDMSIYVWMHGYEGHATTHHLIRPGKSWSGK